MNRVVLTLGIVLATAAAAGGWYADRLFVRIGSITTGETFSYVFDAGDGGGYTDAGLAFTNMRLPTVGSYIKVSCPDDAYVGVGDGGTSCFATADGGRPCDWIRFSLGEKYYVQTMATTTHVAVTHIDAGAIETCTIFEARN